MEEEKFQEAARLALKIIDVGEKGSMKNAIWLQNCGLALLKLDQHEEAFALYKKAQDIYTTKLEEDPNDKVTLQAQKQGIVWMELINNQRL